MDNILANSKDHAINRSKTVGTDECGIIRAVGSRRDWKHQQQQGDIRMVPSPVHLLQSPSLLAPSLLE